MFGHHNYRQYDFFWGALVGGTVATLTSLLFTTKQGKKIQQCLADKYEAVEGSVKEAFTNTKEKLEDTAEQVGKKLMSKTKNEDALKDSK